MTQREKLASTFLLRSTKTEENKQPLSAGNFRLSKQSHMTKCIQIDFNRSNFLSNGVTSEQEKREEEKPEKNGTSR